MKRHLIIESGLILDIKDIRAMLNIVENQSTTDMDEPGKYVLDGIYHYTIDDEYNVILKDIKY